MAKNLKRLKKQVEREHGKLEALKYVTIDFGGVFFAVTVFVFKLFIILCVSVCLINLYPNLSLLGYIYFYVFDFHPGFFF